MKVSPRAQMRLAADVRNLGEQLRAAIAHADRIVTIHATAEQLAMVHGRLLAEIDAAVRELEGLERRLGSPRLRRGSP